MMCGVVLSLEVTNRIIGNRQRFVQEVDMAIEERKTEYVRVQHKRCHLHTRTRSTITAMRIKPKKHETHPPKDQAATHTHEVSVSVPRQLDPCGPSTSMRARKDKHGNDTVEAPC